MTARSLFYAPPRGFPVIISNRFEGTLFAVVTVAILLSVIALRTAVASYSDIADNASGTAGGLKEADTAVTEIQNYINRGIGDVVRRLFSAKEGSADRRAR